jgi:hypothetical protein
MVQPSLLLLLLLLAPWLQRARLARPQGVVGLEACSRAQAAP